MNHTSGTHSGLLVTGTGDDIEIDLEVVGGRTLRMSAAGDELGAWPIEECHIAPDPERAGSFRLLVDGEDAGFTPADPTAFQALVDRIAPLPADGFNPVSEEDEVPTDATAADDPVAFLFGSARPPTPVTAELPDFDPYDAAGGAPMEDPTDDRPGEPAQIDEFANDDDPAAEVEDIDPVMAGAMFDHDTETEATQLDDPAPAVEQIVEPEPERQPFAPLEPDDPEPASVESDHPDIDVPTGDEMPDGAGGSALSRLSAAIGSLRSSSEPEADTETAASAEVEYELGPNTVASDVLETQRALREHRMKEVTKGKWLKAGLMAGGAAAIIALFAFLTPRAIDFLQSYESEPDEAVTTEVAADTTTTVAPTTTLAPQDTDTTAPAAFPTGDETIFDRPSPEFVSAWETAGGAIDEVLVFDQLPQLGPFEEQFTPFLSMTGVVQPDGTLNEFQLVIDPTGPAEYDRIGIQALGVAIATVDPERSPEGRAALLGQLGLNVRQPQLQGIDGAVEAAGISYTLVYDAAANLLTMTVTPAG